MDSKTKNQLLNELENLTRSMNVPTFKQKDVDWLLENIETNNVNHKNLSKVKKICQLLKKEG